MIPLRFASEKLQVVLTSAITTNQLPCVCSFWRVSKNGRVPDKTATNTNSTTDVNLALPAEEGEIIEVDSFSIYNRDTVNAEVTVKIDNSGTEFILCKITIGTGERLEYSDGSFKVYTSAGAVKTSQNQGNNAVSSSLSATVLGTNQTNNNAVANTIQDVTGLSFPVTAGNTYFFRFTIHYTAAATTTGSRWTINGPAATAMRYRSEYSLTTTSRTINDGLSAYDNPAASNASSAATGSNIAIIEGYITPSANGNVIARFASEVAASAIVALAGSTVHYQQVL